MFTTVCITLEIPCVDIYTLKILEQIVARKKQAKPWLTNDG